MGEDKLGVLQKCSPEDAVQALLDYLVDPVLPLKTSVDEVPSLEQQQIVAKQVHAVVLLYNYYHKKQHPDTESLGFESFVKLAVIMKPALMGHMKLMHRSDYAMLDDLEGQLSVMEKTIMDACDISSVLDASKDAPNIEEWPVSKVAVLLTDSCRENCLLQFGSITHGVWSVIEKDLDNGTTRNKRKRKSKKLSPLEANAEEAACLQLALSSVKEVTGIDEHNLSVLESHVVYSLSKEKTATRFYIMLCVQSISTDLQVSIRSVIESLQGPLVRRSPSSWTVTPVVEYFHLLPYCGILLDCFSRKVPSDTMARVELQKEDDSTCTGIDGFHNNEDIEDTYISDVNPSKKVTEIRDDSNKSFTITDSAASEANGTNAEALGQRDDNAGDVVCLSNFSTGPRDMDIDDSSARQSENSKINNSITKFYQRKKKTLVKGSRVKVEMDFMTKSHNTDFKDRNEDAGSMTSSIISADRQRLLMSDLASDKNTLSGTALRLLVSKRHKLSLQLRNLEDEIADCDRNIQSMLNGVEEDMTLKIESITDGCNSVSLKGEPETGKETCSLALDQSAPLHRTKRLAEAVLDLQSSCQELDDISYTNNWNLPSYNVSPADGKFQANVTVKGLDFEFSEGGDWHSNRRCARESAAAKMISKLQSMAGKSH